MTKQIPLTQKKFAIVDSGDYDWLNQWKWYAVKTKNTWYAKRNSNRVDGRGVTISMHRIIMNAPDNRQVDHINHNGLDNRKFNLSLCLQEENVRNRICTSAHLNKYKGVDFDRHGWRSRITINKKVIFLGYFDSAIEAAKIYNEASLKYHGEFACLNEILHL